MPTNRYNQGWNTNTAPEDLAEGEMQQATGVYYRSGDRGRPWKIPGRSAFGDTGSAAKVKGLALCRFDTADDLLLAYSGTTIYKATAGKTGTFSSLLTGVTGNVLDRAHFNDQHFVATGDLMRVLESDGTFRLAGMRAPAAAPVATAGSVAAGLVLELDENTSGFTTIGNATDSNVDTFSHAELSAAGTATTTLKTATATNATYTVFIKWALSGSKWDQYGFADRSGLGDTGAEPQPGYNVTVKLELSVDGGVTFPTEILNWTLRAPQSVQTAQVDAGLQDADDIRVKATLTYNSGTSPASLHIYQVRVQSDAGSGATEYSTASSGLFYAYTEYDQTRGLESPPSPISPRVTLSSDSRVTLDLPDTAQNTIATHYRIYRTTDGAEAIDMGLIGSVAVTADYVDDFTEYGINEQPPITIAMMLVEGRSGTSSSQLPFPRDTPPPALRKVGYQEGMLWGLTSEDRRELRYSVAAFPESWPEVFRISAFPLDDNDRLVDCESLGSVLIIGAEGAMLLLDELPRTVDGQFIASAPQVIKGAPGVVSEYGMAQTEIDGESHVAWISLRGIQVTNGYQFRSISEDISWNKFAKMDKSGWVLHWDEDWQVLIFAYSSQNGIGNDRYALLHMDPDHRKANNQPKWTGPHYGKIAHLQSGVTGGRFRRYSAHWTDGKVYLDNDDETGADASSSYSGTQLPLILKGRKAFQGWNDWTAFDARLRHGNFGSGETLTVAYETGRLASDYSEVKSQSVSLADEKPFSIWKSGEWHTETLTHTGTGSGYILDLTLRASAKGKSGIQRAS